MERDHADGTPLGSDNVAARAVDGRIRNHAAFIWSVADLLRGDYKRSEYGRVILPLTVLRRLDGVLAPTKEQVLKRSEALPKRYDAVLNNIAGVQFNNVSELDLRKVLDDPSQAADQLRAYVAGFSENVREVFEKFDLDTQISRLDSANLLYLVLGKFVDIDLGPQNVSNTEMGYIYEELVRKFSELSNETAGEHFTPREVVELMVNLLFIEDDDLLSKPGTVKTMLDPACGTGGMLSVSEQYLESRNPDAHLEVYGQELNAETYAVCRSDMLLKDPENIAHIVHGNSFSQDGHGRDFDYLLANPPFGVEWKKIRDAVEDEHNRLGFAGRFGAGLPRINDGSFLFLQHMISKMKPVEEGNPSSGSRVAIVFNGSPLFTGAAGSGESEIRRWILENDWLEAVVALPDQLFYNTGISTYFWIVTNRKSPERKGKVQLIDARASWEKMRKSLGEKRKRISDDGIADIEQLYRDIVRLYGDLEEDERVKILPNESFGALRITVERPLRLRWEVTEETLAAVAAEKKLSKLDDETREQLVSGLAEYAGLSGTDKEALAVKLAPVFAGFGLTRAQESAVWDALAVRDPEAPMITDKKGEPLPDPELRDHENVPLPEKRVVYEADVTARLESVEYRTAIRDYMQEEVLPYVPDAWVDYGKTKIGYEIPLTRHFYVSTRAPIGYVSEAGTQMAFNQGCRGLVPQQELDSRFYRYTFVALADELSSHGQGSTFFELPSDSLAEFPIPLPALREQRAIADFLDAETARIDALIEKKRRMIELSDERFAAHVEKKTHASAVGKVKDGPLPDKWRSVLLRRCLRLIQYGIGEATRPEGTTAVLGMGNVDQGEIVGNPGGFVEDIDSSLLIKPGDLLFNRTNSLALVGKVALVRGQTANTATTFASYLVRLRTNHMASSAYLNYLLNTKAVLGQARSMALPSIGQANLNPSRYTSMHIPLPPVQIQRSIAKELDQEAANRRKLSKALTKQIELLTEHRQALITAAVTGRLEVTGLRGLESDGGTGTSKGRR